MLEDEEAYCCSKIRFLETSVTITAGTGTGTVGTGIGIGSGGTIGTDSIVGIDGKLTGVIISFSVATIVVAAIVGK